MSRPAPRELTVLRKQMVTPNMVRVTLGGEGMAQFPADQASAYVKLMFPQPGQERPLLRTYTVRAQREGEIDIDFVKHQDAGPACRWALNTQPGDTLMVGGPGPKRLIDPEGDWFLLVGDMTALPAISVSLEELPADARGHAVIEVISEEDIQPLKTPANLQLHWCINPEPGQHQELLLERVRQLEWLEGTPAIWCACELNSMRRLRDHFRAQPAVDRKKLYISSYWKLGVQEEEHKRLKQQLG